MPATLTYPGVYIEELPSGVNTITGVATSIAAFVGWAPEGPTDSATLVQSWSDYQTQFGGLTQYNSAPNYLGYAVNQFFANGGQQAYIIRLVGPDAATAVASVPAEATAFTVTVNPASVGTLISDPTTLGIQISAASSPNLFNFALISFAGGTINPIGPIVPITNANINNINALLASTTIPPANTINLSQYITVSNPTATPLTGTYRLNAVISGVTTSFSAGIPAVPPAAFTVTPVQSTCPSGTYGIQLTPVTPPSPGNFNFALYSVVGGTATQIGSIVPVNLSNATPWSALLATVVNSTTTPQTTFGTYITIAGTGQPVLNPSPDEYYIFEAVQGSVPVTIDIPSLTAPAAFKINAIDPGQWANNYGIRIAANSFDGERFNLNVVSLNASGQETVVESFPSLSADPNDTQSQFVEAVINDAESGSAYIKIVIGSTTGLPAPNPIQPAPGISEPAYILSGGLDGTPLAPTDSIFLGLLNTAGATDPNTGRANGVYLLAQEPIFNLLCVPGLTTLNAATTAAIQGLQQFCNSQRAFYIVDAPNTKNVNSLISAGPGNITGAYSINSALYFPWVIAPDPLNQYRTTSFPPCGFVAGLYAATDAARGVWKAPAGIDASLTGATGLTLTLTDAENGSLNPQAINCLRNFRVYGNVIWGARTLQGNDEQDSQWKYVPIRRLALYLESSLYDGTQWVVFEPNDEPLWSQIRLNVGAFMQGLFLQGAFQGSTPQQAYFVKCDSENNPQSQIDLGIVTILVGFAPLYPAEFVVIQIQQMAGQLQS